MPLKRHKIIFFIHGINTPRNKDLENHLRGQLPKDTILIIIWWPSRGTIRGDIANLPNFMAAIGTARLSLEDAIKSVGLPDLVIVHSMGQVVRMHLSLPPKIKTISLGGPLHHQFISRIFRSFGFARRTVPNVTSFYNPDDPIVGKFPRKLKGAKNVMIDVPGKGPYKDEHEILLYLEDEDVAACIRNSLNQP